MSLYVIMLKTNIVSLISEIKLHSKPKYKQLVVTNYSTRRGEKQAGEQILYLHVWWECLCVSVPNLMFIALAEMKQTKTIKNEFLQKY